MTRQRARASNGTNAGVYSGSWGDEPIAGPVAVTSLASRALASRALARDLHRSRPYPDASHVGDDVPERTIPDLRFADWLGTTFIKPDGILANDAHEHLMDAAIGVLWTNVGNMRGQNRVLGTAELPRSMGTRWQRARAEQQIRDWFEYQPDFLLTFYAPEVAQLDDASFCALVEHELHHCAQALDHYGAARFDRATGRPLYALKGHDSEEFVDVVARYGVGAVDSGTRRLVAAAGRPPLLAAGAIASACGVTAARAA
jgi:Putative phage metallopeptidase